MITIKEIAVLAEVSPGTVDRVIHNRSGVSKKTSERIRKLLKDYNFKLNDVASKLANRKKYKLATFLPSYDEQSPFWKSPYLGILEAKEEVGFYGIHTTVYSFNQFNSISYLSEFDSLMDSQPDAVILVPTFKEETKKIVKSLESANIPYLFLNIDIEGCNNITFVGQDSYKSGKLVAKLMHVSLAAAPEVLIVKVRKDINNNHAISNRVEGFTQYYSEKNIEVKSHNLTLDTLKDEGVVKQELANFFKVNPKVKGLYMPSSQIAVLVESLNTELLKELTLIGHDTTENNVKFLKEDKITFLISQKSFNQGYDSVSIISDFLLQNKVPTQKIYSPLEIITKENIA
jgi:LacI family transcriptional regulator